MAKDKGIQVELWSGDQLNRKNEAEFLTKYLLRKFKSEELKPEKSSSFVLNLNAEWGFGKTFFLDKWSEDLKSKGHLVIYFNAWQNDFSESPLLSFIAEINESIEKHISEGNTITQDSARTIMECLRSFGKVAAPLLVNRLTKKMLGASLEEIEGLLDDESSKQNNERSDAVSDISDAISESTEKMVKNMLDVHNTTKNSILEFKESLQLLAINLKKESNLELPLFIFVDELDRCRPSYAIELLETIKHLFTIDNVYFVVANATEQLCHSISAIYGTRFESRRYLNRFFDQEYQLAVPDPLEYCNYLWDNAIESKINLLPCFNKSILDDESVQNFDENVILIYYASKFTKASLRDIEQAIKTLNAINMTFDYKLITLPIVLLVFWKIKHPTLFAILARKWPNSFYINNSDSDTIKISEIINSEHDSSVLFAVKQGELSKERIVTKDFMTILSSILSINNLDNTTLIKKASNEFMIGNIIRLYCEGDVVFKRFLDNRITLDYYVDLVKQAGHLQ